MRKTVMICDNCGTTESNSWISSVYFSWDYCSESCHEEEIRERKKKQNQKELDRSKERTNKLEKNISFVQMD